MMPTRFEQRFKETPRTLYPPIPAEKPTAVETPTLEAPITTEATAESMPVETEQPVEETKKQRRKERFALNFNNLPDEVMQIRAKRFKLYTTALLMLSILGTAYSLNALFLNEQLQNYTADVRHRLSKMPVSLNGVLSNWTFPGVQTNGPKTSSVDMEMQQFTSSRPYKEIWEFYAKKCGYNGAYPADGSGNGKFIIQSPNGKSTTYTGSYPPGSFSMDGPTFIIQSDASAGGRSALFNAEENGRLVNVQLFQLPGDNITRITLSAGK